MEAVPEKIDLKREIFGRLDRIARERRRCWAATPRRCPSAASPRPRARPERVIGMHFFNPVHLMPLLELVRTDSTSDETVERSLAYARIGSARSRSSCATHRASPPAAWVWLLGLEAMRMFEQGVASAEDIDKAMVLGYRHPMGPLRLTDLIGLDVRLAIARTPPAASWNSDAFRPPEVLRSGWSARASSVASPEAVSTNGKRDQICTWSAGYVEQLIPESLFVGWSQWALLLAGSVAVAVLILGADRLVEGASGLAYRLGISKIIVGATVVSLGDDESRMRSLGDGRLVGRAGVWPWETPSARSSPTPA